MYKPLGKTSVTIREAEDEFSDKRYVRPVKYDNIIRDTKVYDLRTTKSVPSYEFIVTEEDRTERVLFRYFVQHKASGAVTEISPAVYKSLISKRTDYHYPSYLVGFCEWRIQGPVADLEINGYIVEGAQTANEYYISEAEKVLPNIRTYLTDPTQFVE